MHSYPYSFPNSMKEQLKFKQIIQVPLERIWLKMSEPIYDYRLLNVFIRKTVNKIYFPQSPFMISKMTKLIRSFAYMSLQFSPLSIILYQGNYCLP